MSKYNQDFEVLLPAVDRGYNPDPMADHFRVGVAEQAAAQGRKQVGCCC